MDSNEIIKLAFDNAKNIIDTINSTTSLDGYINIEYIKTCLINTFINGYCVGVSENKK